MLVSTRRRIILIDRTIKREGWDTTCLVGVHSDAEVNALLSFARKLKITAVFDTSTADSTPANRVRWRAALSRLRVSERVNGKRLRVIEARTDEAVTQLAGEQFDGVVLLGVPKDRLPTEGGLWAALVADGGMLIGTGHEDARVRNMLTVAVPKWSAWRYGLWVVPVVRRIDDPVDAGPDKDDLVHEAAPVVAGAEGEADAVIAQPKRRGRPPGSKNMAKAT